MSVSTAAACARSRDTKLPEARPSESQRVQPIDSLHELRIAVRAETGKFGGRIPAANGANVGQVG